MSPHQDSSTTWESWYFFSIDIFVYLRWIRESLHCKLQTYNGWLMVQSQMGQQSVQAISSSQSFICQSSSSGVYMAAQPPAVVAPEYIVVTNNESFTNGGCECVLWMYIIIIIINYSFKHLKEAMWQAFRHTVGPSIIPRPLPPLLTSRWLLLCSITLLSELLVCPNGNQTAFSFIMFLKEVLAVVMCLSCRALFVIGDIISPPVEVEDGSFIFCQETILLRSC